jgi:hypothetical protein
MPRLDVSFVMAFLFLFSSNQIVISRRLRIAYSPSASFLFRNVRSSTSYRVKVAELSTENWHREFGLEFVQNLTESTSCEAKVKSLRVEACMHNSNRKTMIDVSDELFANYHGKRFGAVTQLEFRRMRVWRQPI